MAIIISQNGKNAKRVDPSSFGMEDSLQQYIYDNPESVPVYEINEDIRLLILAREFPTNSGPIDALGVDQEGTIYVIETKLYKNPDKRLVVAQALDYGASMWRHATDFDDFTNLLETKVQQQFGMSLLEKLSEFFDLEEAEATELLQSTRNNLDAGRFKFVVLMDSLEKRLKDLIVYINQNSQFDVYAVELEYYTHDKYEIIIPKLYGAEVKKDVTSARSSGQRKQWDKNSFFGEIENLGADERTAIKKLFDWAEQKAQSVTYGTGSQAGSFIPRFPNISQYAFIVVYTDGRIRIQFWGYDENTLQLLFDSLKNHLSDKAVVGQLKEACDKQTHKDLTTQTVAKEADNLIRALDEFTGNF